MDELKILETEVNPIKKYDSKIYNKTFYEKNKDKVLEKIICSICCGSYTYYNKSKHNKSNKHKQVQLKYCSKTENENKEKSEMNREESTIYYKKKNEINNEINREKSKIYYEKNREKNKEKSKMYYERDKLINKNMTEEFLKAKKAYIEEQINLIKTQDDKLE